jgi:transcriptional regulator with XRE-family HTH domain
MKETLDQRLQRLRQAKGWTLSQLCSYSQLGEKSITALETEPHEIPKWSTISRLASALGTNAFYLASGDGDDKPFHDLYRHMDKVTTSQPDSGWNARVGR